jgi:hypothetical protein
MRVTLPLLALAARAAPSPKRGFVANTGSQLIDATLLASGTSWYYAYEMSSPYCPSTTCAVAQQFLPQPWCLDDAQQPLPAYANRSGTLLGFNEPNFPTQCNKSPAQVAAAWGALAARWPPPGTLASPAVALNGSASSWWLDEFFAQCTALYGAGGCAGIAYVAVHDYSCDAPTTMAYLDAIYQRYQLPVILSEFACGSVKHKRPVAEEAALMRALVPLLEAAPHVARFSWMSARDPDGLRNLVEAGAGGGMQLSELGRLYVSL